MKYKKGFGFASPGRDIINDGGRVGGIELSGIEDHALVTSSVLQLYPYRMVASS
ncbi:unnamed protein product [Clavelina lepadiformis]|uniref:Uncharacterized protein n=1 Tax=Clavelina lepadiformis TaxID=159417 RepID=A0ABP0GJG8_CLALP